MLRSEKMGLYQMIIPRESAYDVLNILGQLNALQFIDNDPSAPQSQRPFYNYVKRCEELLTKVQYLMKEMEEYDMMFEPIMDLNLVLQFYESKLMHRQSSPYLFLNEVEEYVNKKASFVVEQSQALEKLEERYSNLHESLEAMIQARQWLGASMFMSSSSQQLDIDEEMEIPKNQIYYKGGMIPASSKRLTHFVGVINTNDFNTFQKTTFRITRGNFMMYNGQINKLEHQQQQKTAFLVIFPASQQYSTLWNKFKKIVDSYGVLKVNMPQTQAQWDQTYNQFQKEIDETIHLLKLTQSLIKSTMGPMSTNSLYPSIQYLKMYLVRERYLYINLNKMKIQSSLFVAKLWIRQNQLETIEFALNELKRSSPNLPTAQIQDIQPDGPMKPPTHFKNNQFTKIFQLIVNTYGIPRYREINPMIFTVVTFPFLFGVMFGDIVHGLAILIFGIYLSWTKQFSPRSIFKREQQNRIRRGQQKKQKFDGKVEEEVSETSPLQVLYDLRYLITLCGAFAIYCGFIYNEFMGIQLDLFGSCYLLQDGQYLKTCNYPLGLDPLLGESLSFTNSTKMKLSIVIGFVQMTLGILVYGLNCRYYNDRVGQYVIFPAKLLFFLSTIGYMAFLILVKWLTPWDNTALAPSIIGTLVQMWMQGADPGDYPMWERDSQKKIQSWLLSIASICIPLMLFPPMIRDYMKANKQKSSSARKLLNNRSDESKPVKSQGQEFELIQNFENKGSKEDLFEKDLMENQKNYIGSNQDLDVSVQFDNQEHAGVGDILVHHGIETIEFVLGCISNTASYLRLWALSLAHSQLAEVFFRLTISDSIDGGSWILTIMDFPLFVFVTIGVLLMMDSLECFLHALRLHWVEFQNKFFKGDGVTFEGYSFIKEMELCLGNKSF